MTDPGFNFDNTYARLPDELYTKSDPAPVRAPKMVILNETLAADMGLDFSTVSEEKLAALFGGNIKPEGAEPLAQAYAGHQFGFFTMLGDGRAIVWGEHVTPAGQRFDIQFKGSGRTPYSRNGDGRAALGPMLREYIISEAMHHMGIPTTRSLAVVTTGEKIYREKPLPGSILTRVAASHIRIGTFQYVAVKQNQELLQKLVDYTIDRHYPALKEAKNKAIALFQVVAEKQAELIVDWMRVGFIHGVMNTDNMALSGETIDYGPCAFMDNYDPATVFSSIDHAGRYAFANQPQIVQWNLARFAETLLPLLDDNPEKAVKMAEEELEKIADFYQNKWLKMMGTKIGITEAKHEDRKLIMDLLGWMQKNDLDYTNTFRDLSSEEALQSKLYASETFRTWHTRWQTRLEQNSEPKETSLTLMRTCNPAIIPRNHKVQEVLSAAEEEGNFEPLHELLAALKGPYKDLPELRPYQSLPLPSERVCQTFCGT